MIEVKVPKEVRAYKEKIIGPFTLRQLVSGLIAFPIVIPLFIFLLDKFGQQIASYICMAVGGPLLLIGFYEKNGQPFEKYMKQILRFYFVLPQKRKYITQNITFEEDYNG